MQAIKHQPLDGNAIEVGLFVRLEGKPEKEMEIDAFLKSALPIIQTEEGTLTWFAIRIGQSTFAIFDGFASEAGRQAHLHGKVAEALFAKAPELFEKPPVVELFTILAAKLP